jgi:2-oxoisovalerate dehydrogenase E1 component
MDTFVAYAPIVEDVILPQPEDIYRGIVELKKF